MGLLNGKRKQQADGSAIPNGCHSEFISESKIYEIPHEIESETSLD
jgi:hypothetical protein